MHFLHRVVGKLKPFPGDSMDKLPTYSRAQLYACSLYIAKFYVYWCAIQWIYKSDHGISKITTTKVPQYLKINQYLKNIYNLESWSCYWHTFLGVISFVCNNKQASAVHHLISSVFLPHWRRGHDGCLDACPLFLNASVYVCVWVCLHHKEKCVALFSPHPL